MRLFWRKGYAATSVEDLIETLHLSRSSLYDTFGDKRTLFIEALKLYSERVISSTARTLNESPRQSLAFKRFSMIWSLELAVRRVRWAVLW